MKIYSALQRGKKKKIQTRYAYGLVHLIWDKKKKRNIVIEQ